MLPYKKSLGQNFLLNNRIIEKIRDSLLLEKGDKLLEIGAGPGNLTLFLASCVSKLYAVEIDESFREKLAKVEEDFPNVEIIFGDFLKIPIKGELLEVTKATGNLPYNVGTPILERIAYETDIDLCVFMFASGTGNRFLAKEESKEYSALTVFTKSFFKVEKVLFVGKENFYPKPKVDSVVLKFTRLENLDKDYLKRFNRFVIDLFSYRRKTIQNSLIELISKISKNSIIKDSSIKENVKEILDGLNIDPTQRVETLNIETLKLLFETLLKDRLL